jgi:hypothetical protein
MPLNSSLAVTLSVDLTGSPGVGGAVPYFSKPKAVDIALTDGTGNNQVSKAFSATRSVLTAANDDLDLAGVLLDPFGAQLTFATVKAIIIRSDPANTTNLTVSPGPTNGFVGPFGASTHTVQVRPGGALAFVAPQSGWSVTAGTADIFRVANAAGATALYTIEILGT